ASAVLLVVLVATGCGSSPKKGGSPSTSTDDPNAILRIGRDVAGTFGPTFDPGAYNSTPSPNVNLMYDVWIRRTPEGLKPGLAAAWSFPDTSTVELTIRPGVKF